MYVHARKILEGLGRPIEVSQRNQTWKMTEQGMSRSLGSRNHSVGVDVGLIWSCLPLKVMVSLHPKPKVCRTKLKALAWVRGNMPTLPGWRKEEEEKEEEEGE